MSVREYRPTDGTACRNILLSNIPKYFVKEDMPNLESWLKALLTGIVPFPNAESIYYYVLEDDGKVIGSAGFYFMKDENKAQLNWGMVDGAYHNKGLGKLLFDYRVSKIKELDPNRQITLWTSQYTYKFFEKFGMKTESITPNGLGNGYDKYIMYLP